MSKTCIVSDLHLAHPGAQGELFNKIHRNLQSGDTFILLGDILDYWVDRKGAPLHLLFRYNQLAKTLGYLSKKRGVDIHYIPGNHDSFVFDIESYEGTGNAIPDVIRRMNRCSSLLLGHDWLRRKLGSAGFIAASSTIHYPYMHKEIGGRKFLFTHGHYHELLWRLMNGLPSLPGELPHKMMNWSSAIAYCLSGPLRHVLRRGLVGIGAARRPDAYLDEINGVQHMTIAVTNDVLRGLPQPLILFEGQGRDKFLKEVIHQLETVSSQVLDTERLQNILQRLQVERNIEILLEESPSVRCLVSGIMAATEWREAGDLDALAERIRDQLQKYHNHQTYQLSHVNNNPHLSSTSFSAIPAFDTLVIGHRHRPVLDPRNKFHDNGALLVEDGRRIESSLEVTDTGVVLWNPNIP